MHSPATTPDDIKAASKQSPHTTPGRETTSKIPQSRSHEPRNNPAAPPNTAESANPTAKSPKEIPAPSSAGDASPTIAPSGPSHARSNKWLHYAAINRQRGMSTAEYAVGTIAACAFAALLFKVVSSPEVQEMLSSLIDRALNTATG
ncbi:DUF4244 domain-containing protein [Nonomuraea sp. NPDC049400]|uniref:DUF4244 domain-containing protein n=1 Tax=Nonomuraea sp. NPDC049400 TaxID=3364352 RepID=UPI0037B8121A